MKAVGSRKLKGTILFLLALYTFLGFVILPIILQNILTKKMTEVLHRKVIIDQVVTNPYALSMAVKGMTIMEEDGSTVLFSCKRIYGNLEIVSLVKRSLVIREIDLLEPFVKVERFPDGGINLLALVPPEAKGKTEPSREAKPPDERAGSAGIPVEVDRFALHGGRVRFTDRVPGEVFETTLHPIEISVRHFRTEKDSRALFSLALATEIAETVKTEGIFSLDPLFVEGTASVGDLFPGKYFPYVRERLAFSWESGKLDVSTGFRYRNGAPAPEAALSGLDVTLKDLSLLERGEDRPFLRIPEFAVRTVDADLIGGNVAVGEIASRDGTFILKRLKDGSLNVARLVIMPEKSAAPSAGSVPPPAKEAGAPKTVPRMSLKTLAVAGWHILLEDRALEEAPATIEMRDVRLSAEGLSTVPGEKGKAALAFRDPETGTFSVEGTLGIDPLAFHGNLLLKQIVLYPFQPYVQETLDLLLTGGALSVEGSLDVEKGEGPIPAVTFSGSAGLRDFSCAEGKRGEEILRFKTLDILGIRFGLQPNLLKVGEVRGSDFYTRLAVREDLTANVTDILREEEGEKEDKEAKPADEGKKEEASKKKDVKPFFETVAVDRMTLDKGRIDFTDRHVKPAFSAHLYDMTGTISGLLSDNASRADVLLKGSYEKVIPLTIAGKINPLGKDLYVDLKVIFENVDLSPLTPYGRKYLGYPIDKGKLFLNLKYHIENRKLDAQNVVLLDQFTLGEPVESPDALKLPIRLAIALLKDRQGKIDLDIPLTGQTDDPQFSIGRLVLKVLGNLIVKAVTAPFALLGSIFGGGEELGFVAFAPGAVQVDEEGRKKIDVLAKALYDRPLLKLEITGHADPAADREALRKARLEELIRAAEVKDLAGKGQKAPPAARVALDPKEYDKYLGEVYKETVPEDERKKIPEKTLSREEREKIVLARLEVSGGDLRQLAYERATQIRDLLLATGKVEKERIFLIEPRPEGKDGESRVRFSLVN